MLMISLSEIETLVILSVLPLCRRSLLPPALFVIKDVAFIFASLEPTLESLANCKISESKFIPISPLSTHLTSPVSYTHLTLPTKRIV